MVAFENVLLKNGFERIAGVDEVGRGSLAGPILAAAVVLDPKKLDFLKEHVKDSKLLTSVRRKSLYSDILKYSISVSFNCVPHHTIDKMGLTYANRKVLTQAVRGLHIAPDYVLCDAFAIQECSIPTLSLIKGDRVSISIAAASIVAKVVRDEMMQRFDNLYPGYNFKNNKGYSSKHHWVALKEQGPCPIHRLSYKGVLSSSN